MKNKMILLAIFLSVQAVYSTAVIHGCKAVNANVNVATIGDSRAEQLGLAQFALGKEFIQDAKQNGVPIILPNQIILQNLGQVGSETADWIDKINNCVQRSQNFTVPPKVVVSLGGNSLGVYIKEKYDKRHAGAVQFHFTHLSPLRTVENWLSSIRNAGKAIIQSFRRVTLKGFLKKPFKTLGNLGTDLKNVIFDLAKNLTGNPTLHQNDFKLQWEWEDNVQTDRIASDMRGFILPHFLNQSSDHRIILGTIQPVAPASAIAAAFVANVPDQGFYYMNAIKLFNMLHRKYRRDVFVPLHNFYGDRIVLLDTYWAFWNNILRQNSSYYIADGIHFSTGGPDPNNLGKRIEGGMEYWGKMIAVSMVAKKWFTTGLHPAAFLQLYIDSDVQSAIATINHKSKSIGIESDLIEVIPHDVLNHGFSKYFSREPIVITYPVMGVEVDFTFDNDIGIYVKNGENIAYGVRGDIRLIYDGNNGPDGIFGFPLGEETTSNLESFRSQNFECGTITKNYLDIIQPNKLNLNENLETCKAKKARDAN
jgi:hypothetical protein